MKDSVFTPELVRYIESIESEFDKIPGKRILILNQISDFIDKRLKSSGEAELLFICTHNSRRSQFGQIWAAVAAEFYSIQGIKSFSGGTEATSFNPGAVVAVERTGLRLTKSSQNPDNPEYKLQTAEGAPEMILFSKRYDDTANPNGDFCAIMVCSDADSACPYIPGALERISLPYEDPKEFDGTSQEKLKYDETCREISREIHYVLGLLG